MIYRFIVPMLLMSFMISAAPAQANTDLDFMKKIERAFIAIAKGVKPTVVSIRVERKKGDRKSESPVTPSEYAAVFVRFWRHHRPGGIYSDEQSRDQ